MPRTRRLTSMLLVAYAVAGLTGCDGGSGPSAMPQVVEGTLVIRPRSIAAFSFWVEREGTLSSVVSWSYFLNDINTGLLRGSCTSDQVASDEEGCRVADALAFDDTSRRPSVFDALVTPGRHTLLMVNRGFSADTCFYRLEIN